MRAEIIDGNEINDRSLHKLTRAIANSQGHFSLILARSNYRVLTRDIVRQLHEECGIALPEFQLPPSVKTLYTAIRDNLPEEQPQGLLVFGLESVDNIEKILNPTNQVREEFRQQFRFPLVLWVNDRILQQLTRFAPDFKSWAAIPIKFELGTQELLDALEETVDSVVLTLLDVGAGKFLEREEMQLPESGLRLTELDMAFRQLEQHSHPQDTALDANLHFLRGREADAAREKESAKECYERSWQRWQEVLETEGTATHWTHYGCLLFYLGLWWRDYATLYRNEYEVGCRQAKDYYQQCLQAFRQADRPDLEQKFINALGEVLTRLEAWPELERVARKAVGLHETYADSLRLAHGYGLLAEVALARENGEEAQRLAQSALQLNQQAPDSDLDWSWHRAYLGNYYRWLLARSQEQLQQLSEAVENLEIALRDSLPEHDPPLYIRILESLRSLKFQAGEYLAAFEIKQEKQSIEQQYGLRAFVGAGRLQVRRQVTHLGLPHGERPYNATAEIAASGRLQDIERLISRMGRTDCKLTIIHGQSGVGKSSLVQVGLVPALRHRAIEARDVLPVLVQSYGKWAKSVGAAFPRACEHLPEASLPVLTDAEAIVTQLQEGSECDWFAVLIFDQFEEFFFAYKDPSERKEFFQFLADCLYIPYVKVILSLREDYLHYLLECNRLVDLRIIDDNILDKNILYYLGNLAPDDARSVIETLTTNSQFYLDADLVDALVEDLARDLGEVRPIELQIVGAQLQTENITTLAQFQEYGSKEALVERFLDEIIRDCGPDNGNLVRILLYLLTDENNTRPLKTRAELKNEVELTDGRLDSILNILVRSGLVFQVPGFPDKRYQLVHDYLVSFIRQRQSQQLIAELEKERQQRKLTEARLNQALKKNLRTARRATATLAGLLFAITGIAGIAIVTGINLYVSNLISKSSSASNTGLDRLVSAIDTGKTLKKIPFVMPSLHLQAQIELNNAMLNLDEINRLEGHRVAVNKVVFSPDDRLIASADEDSTIKIWDIAGNNRQDLIGHSAKITAITFSSDNRFIASVSEDDTLKIWQNEGGKEIQQLSISKPVTGVSFSPDNKVIALSSGEIIERWDISTGSSLPNLKGHDAEIARIAFSSDGKIIVSSDINDRVKLWDLETGKSIADTENYGTVDIGFSEDTNQIILVSKDGSVKYYGLDLILARTLEPEQFFGISGWFSSRIKVFDWQAQQNFFALVSRYNPRKITLTKLDTNVYIPSSYIHKDRINSFSFSHNGKMIVSGSEDGIVKIWNIRNISDGLSRNNTGLTDFLAFNRDGEKIITTHSNNKIQLLNAKGEHQDFILADTSIVQLTPNSEYLITGNAENNLQVYDVDDRGNIEEKFRLRHSDVIAKTRISPDKRMLVSVSDQGYIKFYSNNGKLIKSYSDRPLDTTVSFFSANRIKYDKQFDRNIIFSPDNKRVSVITTDGKNSGVSLFSRDEETVHQINESRNEINRVEFSPDSRMIATIGDDNLIYLYTNDGERIEYAMGHKNQVSDFSFSSDSTMLASVSNSSANRSEIKIWNVDNLQKPAKTWNSYMINSIYFDRNNQNVLTSHNDNTIQIWNLEGQVIKTLEHPTEITKIRFSKDGEIIASVSADDLIYIWNKNGQRLGVLRQHSDRINQVIFNPQNNSIASVSQDGMVNLWRQDGTVITLQPSLDRHELENSSRSYNLEFSDNGKMLMLMSQITDRDKSVSTVKWWDEEGKSINSIDKQGHWQFYPVSFSPVKFKSTKIQPLHDLQLRRLDSSELKVFSKHEDQINSVSFSPEEEVMASASDDGTVKLWSLDGEFLKSLPHEDKVNTVDFSPELPILASGSDDKTLQVWDRDGNPLDSFKHEDEVNKVSFSQKGKFLASASGKLVRVWQQKGESLKEIDYAKPLTHDDVVTDIYFSDNGRYIASTTKSDTSSSNDVVKIWRVSNGELIEQLRHVEAATFSPNSEFLATKDTILMLDNLWGDRAILSMPYSPYSWNKITFNADGTKIAIADNNGVQVLDLDLDKLLVKACGLAKDYLENNETAKKEHRGLCDGIAEE
ncbi:eIF2A-related protein [Roseofilum casamattae]|uniref:Novel STAND NTPase 1 domain-containing protein n=1 Tax=Roseofilum casamattae BLCC-M143 TaxID=3022442 RepID=A0ABT7C1Y0_9CYAN|nr:hypothetical protein [Roseofilum casamattae]MDJ1185459.1 hypothetical protein [Roseofilum casamattae BLCC-M143]